MRFFAFGQDNRILRDYSKNFYYLLAVFLAKQKYRSNVGFEDSFMYSILMVKLYCIEREYIVATSMEEHKDAKLWLCWNCNPWHFMA